MAPQQPPKPSQAPTAPSSATGGASYPSEALAKANDQHCSRVAYVFGLLAGEQQHAVHRFSDNTAGE
jgi:hypothetical protein